MPQPESTANTASGAEALMAAASRSGRQKRHVPVPKPGAGKTGTADAPEKPSTGVKVTAEGQDTDPALSSPQAPAGAPELATKEAPPQETAPDAPKAESAAPPSGAPSDGAETGDDAPPEDVRGDGPDSGSGGEIAFPQQPLDYNQLFAKRTKPPLDPAILTMLRERQTKIVKSLASIMKMFLDRQEEYAEAVEYALKLGMPREEMMKIAVAQDCVPILTALLHADGDDTHP